MVGALRVVRVAAAHRIYCSGLLQFIRLDGVENHIVRMVWRCEALGCLSWSTRAGN